MISCLKRLTQTDNLSIVASIHQPNTAILAMFDQLYVLARGGVCIYSAPPGEIVSRLAHIPAIAHNLNNELNHNNRDNENDNNNKNISKPIVTQQQQHFHCIVELLIKYSCSNDNDPIVRQLVHADSMNNNYQMDAAIDHNNTNKGFASLSDQYSNNLPDQSTHSITTATTFTKTTITTRLQQETQLVPDGVGSMVTNRNRFSLASVRILCQRYIAYIRGYLWHHLVAFIILSLTYGYILTIFFDPAIARPSGCLDIEDVHFNATLCLRTPEKILEEYQLTENYKYNYFWLVVFLFLLMLQSSLIFGKEFVQFQNEHRNGKRMIFIYSLLLFILLLL